MFCSHDAGVRPTKYNIGALKHNVHSEKQRAAELVGLAFEDSAIRQ